MANYRAVSSGVWSELARWEDDSGGSYAASSALPTVGDIVYANNFTITLDIDIQVDELRTTSATNINAGGLFDFGTASTVEANVIAGTTVCLRNNTANTKNILGSFTGGSGTSAHAIQNNSTGITIITGSGSGGSNSVATGIHNASSGTVILIGTVTGGTASFAYGISNNSGIINVIGSVIGGFSLSAYGVWNNSGTVTVTGVCLGGSFVDTSANQPVGLYNVNGIANVSITESSLTQPGIRGVNNPVIINQAKFGASGMTPFAGLVLFESTDSNSIKVILDDSSTKTLIDPAVDFPSTSDVRKGVTYATGSLTGTLEVPSPEAVALGVPVDNTKGTAIININDILAILSSFKILS